MLVMHHARGLIQHLPAAFPRHESQIRVFQIKRREQFIESAQLEKLPPVECARAPAAIKAREEAIDGGIFAMAHAQPAILPPAFGQARFFAALRFVAEENLAGDGEDRVIREAREQRREEVRLHAHIGVEQHDDIVLRRAKPGIRTAAEAQVFRQAPARAPPGNSFASNPRCHRVEPLSTTTISLPGCRGDRGNPGRQKSLQQIPAIPVGNHERCGSRLRPRVRRVSGGGRRSATPDRSPPAPRRPSGEEMASRINSGRARIKRASEAPSFRLSAAGDRPATISGPR